MVIAWKIDDSDPLEKEFIQKIKTQEYKSILYDLKYIAGLAPWHPHH